MSVVEKTELLLSIQICSPCRSVAEKTELFLGDFVLEQTRSI
jgi:hypothetical protein